LTDYQVWPATDGPGAATVDGGVVLATEFYVTADNLYATALRFWRADTSILGPVAGRLYAVTDATAGVPVAGTDVTFTLAGTGWRTALFASPVLLTKNQRYRACAQFPTNYSATSHYWDAGGGSVDQVNGPLVAPTTAHATGGDQGSFVAAGSLTFPVNSFGAASYWVDVTVTDAPAGPTSLVGSVAASITAASEVSAAARPKSSVTARTARTGGPA
jgi:hypothetical protein